MYLIISAYLVHAMVAAQLYRRWNRKARYAITIPDPTSEQASIAASANWC